MLRCWDDDDEEGEPHSLKWDSVIAEGMLILNEDDDEVSVRKKVSFALGNKFPLLGANDFEFVKVKQKRILILELGPGTEYNYPVVKKMAGQGILYMKIKQGYEFVYDGSENVDNNEISGFVQGQKENESPRQEEQNPPVLEPSSVQLQVPLQQAGDTTGIGTGRETPTISEPGQKVQPLEADDFFSTVVNEFPSTIVEPTEMLRYLQKKIVKGRPLDIIDLSAVLEGDVNYITVDRENILETTFEELKNVDDPRVTFQVQFYEENGIDSGGPRKEWIRLCNQSIKQKYFDNGLQDHLCEDYFYVGQMVGIAFSRMVSCCSSCQKKYCREFLVTKISHHLLVSWS